MEAIEGLDRLHLRFVRLRHVVEQKRLEVQWLEDEVRTCFQVNDMAGIADLALERDYLLRWIAAIEAFVTKWETKWEQHEAASGWMASGIHAVDPRE
ncbi:hypothetical protein DFP93_11710 [Aneurinibacillus soli]|uniref:Uncharacterized protein n=1 Tax=Aneurinibacillus soli TaxID=1500254 RepID=A0A0U5BG17_9BACL|nr:hypothetical protein [Aneurinibacillus soli]PYE59447.1 hypothetical protein DFP93_11710 [Aneurinibacillus soli]BAU29223.1 hypothetical protein CB4_03410 [Aneurinibacillus soli]